MSKSILWVISPFFLFLSGCPGDQSRSDPPPSSHYDCAPKIVSDGKCFYNLPNALNGQIFDRTFTEDLAVRTQGITVGKGQWKCVNNFWEITYYKYRCLFCPPAPDLSLENCQSSLDGLIRSLPYGY